jgi:hypothetical protein
MAQWSKKIKGFTGLFPAEKIRAQTCSLEQNIQRFNIPVMDTEGTSEKRKILVRNTNHDKLPRMGV